MGDDPGKHDGAILTTLRYDQPFKKVIKRLERCLVTVTFGQGHRPEGVLDVVGREIIIVVKSVEAVGDAGKRVTVGLRDDVKKPHVDSHAVEFGDELGVCRVVHEVDGFVTVLFKKFLDTFHVRYQLDWITVSGRRPTTLVGAHQLQFLDLEIFLGDQVPTTVTVTDGLASGFGNYPELETLNEWGTVLIRVEEAIEVSINKGLPVRALVGAGGFNVCFLGLSQNLCETIRVIHTPPLLNEGASFGGDILP